MALKDIKTKPVNNKAVIPTASKPEPKRKNYVKDPRKVSTAFQTDPAKFTKYNRRYGTQFSKAWDDPTIERLADDMYEWFVKKDENIWLYEFCNEKMVARDSISKFCKENEYFKYMHTICMDIQETKLVQFGLRKDVRPTMTIFILKNSHNWSDRRDLTVSTVDGVSFVDDGE